MTNELLNNVLKLLPNTDYAKLDVRKGWFNVY